MFALVTGTATKHEEKKYVTKYNNMRKWMVEFLRKFENRLVKIA